MDSNNYKYNAFISYRHNDLDKYVAENLQRLIETYKMPKSIIEKYNITDNNFRRVFRDQDELPLSSSLEDPIIDALKESEFLLVICSPRLNESKWCKKEIENFIKFHGRDHILCVLVEGEPDESFPEILKYRKEKVISKNGKERTKKVPCEPLAMDVRGKDKKEIYQKLKNEFIRAIAPMYNLDYDDIKRRHEERELKRKANVFKIVAVASIIFAIYSFMLFSRIYSSSKELKYNQAINLSKESRELLLNEDRVGSVEKAYQSVTEYNNIELPVTPEGIYQLTDSLGVYYNDSYSYATFQLDTVGSVQYIKTDSTREYLLSYDTSNELILWNLKTKKRIQTVKDIRDFPDIDIFTFIGNGRYAYINEKKEIIINDFNGKELKRIKPDFYPNILETSKNGKYLKVNSIDKVCFYDMKNYDKVFEYTLPKDMNVHGKGYFDESEDLFVFSFRNKSFYKENGLTIITINIPKKQVINKQYIQCNYVAKIILHNDAAVVLLKKQDGKKTDTVIYKYNYKNGKKYFLKEYKGETYSVMEINTSVSGKNTILVSGYDIAYLLDYNTGKQKAKYTIDGKAVTILSVDTNERYLLFSSKGYLYSVNPEGDGNDSDNCTWFPDIFNTQLSNYHIFLPTKVGYLTYVGDNRIIGYSNIKNGHLKETEYKEERKERMRISEINDLAKEYNNDRKSLIYSVFYSDDKSLIFLSYNDGKLEIYDTKTKKLLKDLQLRTVDYYLGKTSNNETIIMGTGGYILDKNYDLIAHVPQLCDYCDDKLIVKEFYSSKYYETKIYSSKEIIEQAKIYLKERGR